jgi:hypothetical protein
MSYNNILAQRMTLLLDFCDVFIKKYQDRANTPFGFKVNYSVQVGFTDYRYQHKFDLMQLEYENQFRRLLKELPDTEMEFPVYMPQSWQQFWRDAEKAGRAMDILGPSPQNYLDRIILFGEEKPSKVESRTENIPEIRPAEQ